MVEAGSGAQALAAVEARLPDVLVVDVGLPDMSGVELVRRVRSRHSDVPVVFATGHDADGETLPGWAGLALSGATVAVYMGHAAAAKVSARLIEAGLAATTPVAVIENASRHDRRAYQGRLDELALIAARPELTGPVLIIIGEVVAAGAIGVEPAALAELAA